MFPTLPLFPPGFFSANVIDDIYVSAQRRRRHWIRQIHAMLFNAYPHLTNKLFATLLLGLQLLVDTEVLPPAHLSMLEDTLEGWTMLDQDTALHVCGYS